LAGEAAAIEALRAGSSVQRENLVQVRVTIELALVGAGVALSFVRNLVRAIRRSPPRSVSRASLLLWGVQELIRHSR
jgi:hypothetical protein